MATIVQAGEGPGGLHCEEVAKALRHGFRDRGVTVREMHRLSGGFSRETWLLRVDWKKSQPLAGTELILRRDATGGIVSTPLRNEFEIYRVLRGSGLPVPTVYFFGDEGGDLERPYYVMSRCEGEAAPETITALDVCGRQRLAHQAMETLAAIHALDAKAVGQAFDGGDGVPRRASEEVARWAEVFNRAHTDGHPVIAAALAWLERNAPAARGAGVVVHGDFRTGNLLHGPNGDLVAVLDWELAHRGEPAEDLGWFCMERWRWSGPDAVGGLVPRKTLLAEYARASGRTVDLDEVGFWELLGNVKLAAIQATSASRIHTGVTGRLSLVRSARFIDHQSLFVVRALLERLR